MEANLDNPAPDQETIEKSKELILNMLKMEKKKKQIQSVQQAKKQNMKKDKEMLKSALEEIGNAKKLNDPAKAYVIKKVPAGWYQSRTLSIFEQAMKNVLTAEDFEKVKSKIKETRKEMLKNCTNVQLKIVIEENEKESKPTKRKEKSGQKKRHDPEKKRQKFIEKLSKS